MTDHPSPPAPTFTEAELDQLRAMFDLARAGDPELLHHLDAGLPVNLTNAAGDTLLILAAYHRHEDLVRGLLAHGADVERVNDRGQTALGCAVFRQDGQVVRMLMDAGADPDGVVAPPGRSPPSSTCPKWCTCWHSEVPRAGVILRASAQNDGLATFRRSAKEPTVTIERPTPADDGTDPVADAAALDGHDDAVRGVLPVSRRRVLQTTTAVAAGSLLAQRAAAAQAAPMPTADPTAEPGTVPDAAPLRVASGDRFTSNQGVRVSSDLDSLRAGSRGPALLEDFYLREKITHFDHERIPERAVHARGAGAHGTFTLTKSLAAFTRAKVLTEVGAKTPVFVRFSTVNGSRGSADTVRDARGWATKFYTSEGIWDLVGNNIPVFFIQDAIKFPDLVHSFKPQPQREIPQAATAHDNFWDFISLTPESMHMVMWAMSDRAIPRSYRMMEGFGIHTFRLVDAKGTSTYVKFHWKPKLGVHSLVWDEAQKLTGADADFHRRDLADAIAAGNGPEYDLAVQLVKEGDEGKLGIDILDPTKLWPEERVPLQVVGTMKLDRNPDNYFAETEQAAFHPGHLVPGIDVTDDPLIQGRLFSYLDTQINRFNGTNFAQLPVNRPHSDVNNFAQDGYMRMANRPGDVNYSPNTLGDRVQVSSAADGGFVSYREPVQGPKVRQRPQSFSDHYSQARMFWLSLTSVEQSHVVDAFRFELAKVDHESVRKNVVAQLAHVDAGLAKQVATFLGLSAPSASVPAGVKPSPALSMSRTTFSAATRKVAILVADGVAGDQVKQLQDALKAAGVTTEVVGQKLGAVQSSGAPVTAVRSLLNVASVTYDAVYIPGGRGSVEKLLHDGRAVHFVEEVYRHYKAIAATGEAAELVRRLPSGRRQVDGVVLGADAAAVAKGFVAAIATDRHWNRPGVDRVSA